MTEIVVCCVLRESSLYGPEQVNKLVGQIQRNLEAGRKIKVLCFTDTDPSKLTNGIQVVPIPNDESLNGWWTKLYMFSREYGDDTQVFYFDLDTVITSKLDNFFTYRGRFGILKDPWADCYNSSIMSWQGSFGPEEIWKPWKKVGMPQVAGGDQTWITHVVENADILQDKFPGAFHSYKAGCQNGLPREAVAVYFHGMPKPWYAGVHEWRPCDAWVHMIYDEEQVMTGSMRLTINAPVEQIEANIRHSSRLDIPWISSQPKNGREIAIVGGGPSINDNIDTIREMKNWGVRVVALNNSAKWLQDNGIIPDSHIILDSRENNVAFVEASQAKSFMIASQAHPRVFEVAMEKGVPLSLWHPMHQNIEEVLPVPHPEYALIGLGSTVGNMAVGLMFALGYGRVHLFGYDSSIAETGAHHAYKQPENDNLNTCIATVNGRQFLCQNWMASQATELYRWAPRLAQGGMELVVHGDGMLPELFKTLDPHPDNPDCSLVNGIWMPRTDQEHRRRMGMEFDGLSHIIPISDKHAVAVQAGGCVGLWAKELSKYYENVYTFEPDTTNFYCLQRNIEGIKNIHAFQSALGEERGRAALNVVPSNAGAHNVVDGDEINVVPIDSLCLMDCDLIILDVEGYELQALKGARETIDRFKPVVVCEEKGLQMRYGEGHNEIEKFMSTLGYEKTARIQADTVYTPRLTVEHSAALEIEGV